MSENPIRDWFKSDPELCEIVTEIEETVINNEERVLAAFHRLSDHFDLPKYPDSRTEIHYARFNWLGIVEIDSIFEEATLLKYLEPGEDPRGIVMTALYNVTTGNFIDINLCAQKYFGSANSIPTEYAVCFIGDGFAGRLHFLKSNESWIEPGAKSARKISNQ